MHIDALFYAVGGSTFNSLHMYNIISVCVPLYAFICARPRMKWAEVDLACCFAHACVSVCVCVCVRARARVCERYDVTGVTWAEGNQAGTKVMFND